MAVTRAARFDRSLVSFQAGLLAAVPVVAVLAGGIAAGDSVAGVTMAAGAMLVGIAWRTTGGRPPLALMATDAVMMSIATFLGCVTGSVPWLHLVLLAVLSLIGGLLVGVGNRGGAVGTQAIIAAVVFGRFSQPPGGALGLAGLVLAGGAAQVLFLTIVRWPTPLRVQRQATASAFRALARLAADEGDGSTVSAGAALDEAAATLGSASLLGDAALMTLRTLVNEGRRMRVALAAIHSLLRSQRDATGAPGGGGSPPRQALTSSAELLELAARAIEGDRDAARLLPGRGAQLSRDVKRATAEITQSGVGDVSALARSAAHQMSRRLAALAGQLRAVASLAPAAGEGSGLRSRRPYPRTSRPLERIRSDLSQMRADASLQSPAGRHALRLAVVVVLAELLAGHLPLQRGYWMVVAAATVLRPEFGATFTRGTERLLGTCFGVGLAGAITVGLHPAGGATVVLVGVLAWAGYSVFPASFAAGFGFITALVVFLLNVVSPDTLATATARLIDTLVGGAIGLLAYVLWPTWSQAPAREALADLIAAQRDYLDAVLAAVTRGGRAHEDPLGPLTRRARMARTKAESTVAISLTEPRTRRIDADESRGALAAMRRLIQAAHVLRLDAEDEPERSPLPELSPLVRAVDQQLETVESRLRSETPEDGDGVESPLPDLRAAYEAFERARPAHGDQLLAELDEIVDAANSLADVFNVEPEEGRRRAAPA